ncbi:MAG: response regulator transcription factor [Chitinophagaceae bacterium]|nr:response regulator transcription factor [Chitinophagaceae bacterium]
MIKSIIVDDEMLSRNTLKKLLEIHCPEVEVVAECEDAGSAALHVSGLKPDLVFLDVAMPGKNGIEFLKEYGEINFEVIFVTAHDKYVLQAIRFAAVDYLSKPVEEHLLITAVTNARKRIQAKTANHNMETFLHNIQQKTNQQEMQLCVPGIKGFQIIKLRDIVYCEADNTYTVLHLTENKKLVASRPLMDYESLLQDTSFIRIHKSFLINIQHLKEYQKGEGGIAIMSNGKHLDVSRRKKEHFINYMKQFFKY